MIASGLMFKKIAKRTNFFLFHFIVPHTVAYIQKLGHGSKKTSKTPLTSRTPQEKIPQDA
jgi:hypothetical protein